MTSLTWTWGRQLQHAGAADNDINDDFLDLDLKEQAAKAEAHDDINDDFPDLDLEEHAVQEGAAAA